jgi:hypothetical protein
MFINRIIRWFSDWPDLLKFLVLVFVTIYATYYAPAPVAVAWYAVMAIAYFFSENEALWLALFLVTADGFASYFGLYEVTLPLLPGLPAVEISQIYIILTVIKAAGKRVKPALFYNKYLQILLIFMIFNVVWGQMMGLSGGLNVYFRVVKGIIPMMLFYSVPRLFVSREMYERFFRLVFVIVLASFAAQLFTLVTGMSPLEAGGIVSQEVEDEGDDFRVFYGPASALTGLFGALYIMSARRNRRHDRIIPVLVVFAAYAMALLSATRGWIISFTFIIVLTLLFSGTLRTQRGIYLVVAIVPLTLWFLSLPVISKQINFARDRLEAIEAISEGDITARGTLMRLDYRSHRTLEGWSENPVFGWGPSDTGYEYDDGHVGNQSLLATSGIVGFVLLNGFLAWFLYMILSLYFRTSPRVRERGTLLVFVFFLAGWFIIHSTSGQQFNYSGFPGNIMTQAVFFSFGALQYHRIKAIIFHGKEVRKGSPS